MKKIYLFLFLFLLSTDWIFAVSFSTAGFFELQGTGRKVYSMNQAWRFHKGEVDGKPYEIDYDDSEWNVVSIPHGIELLPVDASGCANYQGVVWYRKHFSVPLELQRKKLFLHFEGIMGKSEVFVNGKLVKRHFGGYLPVIVDVTDLFSFDVENVIVVKADNSDDTTFPVGKQQNMLDFTYFGGLYRDCWLIAHNKVFITNSNYENEIAGGGLFVSFNNVSKRSAEVNLKLHIRNSTNSNSRVKVKFDLKDKDGNNIKTSSSTILVKKGKASYVVTSMKVDKPMLWSPKTPYLYNLEVRLYDASGNIQDGYRQRIGIRSIEFRQKDGLWINGKPYNGKIMGTNRHQDFAVIGNAVPNSIQWRDAKKLRSAGMEVIRTHYVIDPAFMDACDELGLFALVELPGWQFWNDEPIFAERVYSDIRNMIRIHRNHASLFFWEPILNETHYPEYFAKKALDICNEEYPYPYSVAACDHGASGDYYYPLLLRPIESKLRDDKTYFIREWGDNVDDWNAQNSDSRVARNWGEIPMLLQAEHYALPSYQDKFPILCLEIIHQKTAQIVGACFWHSFDHQRGYHADPFYGGMMDAFRQPKTSYYMFMSQRPAEKNELIADNGPMVYIAHELTPFSPNDVTVYSNCEEVKLTVFNGGKQYIYKKDLKHKGMPSPIIKFDDVFHYMEWKAMARAGKQNDAYLLAEGLIDGKIVATHKRYPSGQPDHIRLRLDDENIGLVADGSDIVTVIAEIVDKRGTVKRLNNSIVLFKVEGEGRLLANAQTGTNPIVSSWGSAPVLVQSTTNAGKIKISASLIVGGESRPLEGVFEFESIPNQRREIVNAKELQKLNTIREISDINNYIIKSNLELENERLRKELNNIKVKEVETQQTYFGVGIND